MSCTPPVGGVDLAGIDTSRETVVAGRVRRDGAPVAGAYVRLLDAGGDFTGEVVTDDRGGFTFLARPGAWTVRALAPGARGETRVTAELGLPADASIDL